MSIERSNARLLNRVCSSGPHPTHTDARCNLGLDQVFMQLNSSEKVACPDSGTVNRLNGVLLLPSDVSSGVYCTNT